MYTLIFCLFSDLGEWSLGVNTFQLAKTFVDKVVTVRYCTSMNHILYMFIVIDLYMYYM